MADRDNLFSTEMMDSLEHLREPVQTILTGTQKVARIIIIKKLIIIIIIVIIIIIK